MKIIVAIVAGSVCALLSADVDTTVPAPRTAAGNAVRWNGCYAVHLGDWSPPIYPANAPYHTPPAQGPCAR
jgi:hypothetical protein